MEYLLFSKGRCQASVCLLCMTGCSTTQSTVPGSCLLSAELLGCLRFGRS
jgi:hypothetical protein